MAVKTRKQGHSIIVTIPSEFNIPSDEIIFIPEESGHQISYISNDAFDLKLDTIFDEYDEVFKALVEKW